MDDSTPTARAPSPDKLRALIVDDEAPARDRLRRMLEELDDVQKVEANFDMDVSEMAKA